MGKYKHKRDGSFGKFKTDGEVSNGFKARERTLEAWKDDSAPVPEGVDMTLESAAKGPKWNQFEANKKKFGVESTFDESIYTTEIDRSHPDFANREKRAIQLAKEIENQTTTNVHIAEDRGLVVDDSGLDEEDKYSGVQQTERNLANYPPAVQTFAEDEARKAMSSNKYVAKHEAAQREADKSTHDNKNKHKFNLSASNFKINGFVPRQQFVPGVQPPAQQPVHQPSPATHSPSPTPAAMPNSFRGTPGMPGFPMMPYGFPGGQPGYPGPMPVPVQQQQPAKVVSPADVKPLGTAFDFFAQLKLKNESAPKAFTTPPNWAATPSVSFVNQFPPEQPAMGMRPFMMPQVPYMPVM